ncbi:hypothetical protein [Muribaculum intestinale]|jgi:hypothetical protein|uniref:hypothetical protein n=1 Tax=Muribaculum intestinale TaxID=1796646 RepID=UPI0012B7BE1A|nr:hypothetical protein [Muribaculum intestinale]
MYKYKFSYLGYVAINWVLTVALLTMRGLDTEADKVQEWLEGAIIFWGGSMVLFLWSKVFVAGDDYKGVGTLNARITRALTFALAIAEAATIYYSMFGHDVFYLPAMALTCIWTTTFIYAACFGKKFILRTSAT